MAYLPNELLLFEVFKRNEQHSKAFTFFLAQMLMMDFMGPSNTSCVPVVCVPEHFESLVNKNIMDEEVSRPIGHNAQTYRPAIPEIGIGPKIEKSYAHDSIKNKESIVTFKP